MSRLVEWPGAAVLLAAVAVAYAGWYAVGSGFSLEPRAARACGLTPAGEGQVVAVFGRYDSYDAAELVRRRALERGFQGTKIAVDPCGNAALVLEGIPSRQVGEDFRAEAKTAGFQVALEP